MSETTSRISSIRDVRAFIAHVASTLDPKSRYISELIELVDAATRVDELESELTRRSRGQRHAGADVFARMSLRDKLLTNLITS